MESFKAVPTEYRGIRYKSKSEAMFARWLDLNSEAILRLPRCYKSFGFEYEPSSLSVNGWTVDFLRWSVYSNRDAGSIPTMFYEFIEYKPSKPTKTYLGSLLERFIKLKDSLSIYDDIACRSSFACYYGSVFNANRGVFELNEGLWFHNESDWLVNEEDEIKEYRFDLETQSCHA